MAICGLHIHRDLKFTLREIDIEILENDSCFTEFLTKLNVRIRVITIHHKIFETVFTMRLDKENIVNLTKPYIRLKLLNL